MEPEKYFTGDPVPRTGEYACFAITLDGVGCEAVRTFKKAKGSRFPECLVPHRDDYQRWLPLNDTNSRRPIGGEWA